MRSRRLILLGCLLCPFTQLLAHHGTLGLYDPAQTVEIQGTISDFRWANPHVMLKVAVAGDQGEAEEWEIELSALSMLRTRGLDQDILHLGDVISVAGSPARDGGPSMDGKNLLLANGTEVLTDRDSTPHFTDPDGTRTLEPVFDTAAAERAESTADGIFRVWATVLNDPNSFPMFKGNYPLTEQAAEAKAAWEPDIEARLQCQEKGMPHLMITPHPIEFVREGDDILMRFEEDDARRLINMSPEGASADASPALLGHSVGRWEEDALVVETARIDAPGLDDLGTPMDGGVRVVERFVLSDDEQRLDYQVSIIDPVTFTEDLELTRYWVWRPELTVHDWNCVD